jgi:hypothetical protein
MWIGICFLFLPRALVQAVNLGPTSYRRSPHREPDAADGIARHQEEAGRNENDTGCYRSRATCDGFLAGPAQAFLVEGPRGPSSAGSVYELPLSPFGGAAYCRVRSEIDSSSRAEHISEQYGGKNRVARESGNAVAVNGIERTSSQMENLKEEDHEIQHEGQGKRHVSRSKG